MKKIIIKNIFFICLFAIGYVTMSLKEGTYIGGSSTTCYDEFKISDLELNTWCLDCRVKRGSEFKLSSHCTR